MSLEAIAALLGHRSMRMTLVYARIADRTVADEYYAVTEQVEALYDTTPVLPASAEGRQMRQLRVETYQRLLGNGYCTRPPELDCVFESICETCTHYQTGLEFQPVLLRQRDHAVEHHQPQRAELFNKLLDGIDNGLTPPPATTLHNQEQPHGSPAYRWIPGHRCRPRRRSTSRHARSRVDRPASRVLRLRQRNRDRQHGRGRNQTSRDH